MNIFGENWIECQRSQQKVRGRFESVACFEARYQPLILRGAFGRGARGIFFAEPFEASREKPNERRLCLHHEVDTNGHCITQEVDAQGP